MKKMIDDGHRHKYPTPPTQHSWNDDAECIFCGCYRREARQSQRNAWARQPWTWRYRMKAQIEARDAKVEVDKMEHKPTEELLSICISELDALVAWEKEGLEVEKRPGLNNFGWVKFDGTTVRHWNRACYGLLSGTTPRAAALFYDYGSWRSTKAARALLARAKGYIHFIANESVFAPCIVSKDADFIMEKGTIYDPSWPSSFICMAGQQLRAIYEHPKIVETWIKLAAKGMDRDLALVLGHWGTVPGNYYKANFRNDTGHAWAKLNQLGLAQLFRLVSHDYSEFKCRSPMRENGAYSNMGRIFGPEGVLTGGFDEPYPISKELPYVEQQAARDVWGNEIKDFIIREENFPLIRTALENAYYAKAKSNDRQRQRELQSDVRVARVGDRIYSGESRPVAVHRGSGCFTTPVWADPTPTNAVQLDEGRKGNLAVQGG